MTCDLHTHSTCSDGQYTPAQLVGLAKEAGIQLLALTDHDTFAGTGEAVEAGRRLGVRVLSGVELSAREYRNLHILGYGFSPAAPQLQELCARMRASRDQRKYRILSFLKGKGVAIDLAEVEALAKGGVVGRPHFAQVMVRHGLVESNREAFDRYLDTEEFQRTERRKASAQECIGAIKAAGGWASLAHPYQIGLENGPLEELVKTLRGYGLDALECWYPRHTAAQRAFYLELADKLGLEATGGSDFHGEKVKPDVRLATYTLGGRLPFGLRFP